MMNDPWVLIVDDDTALLQALPQALSLRLSGVKVDTSDSAPRALEQIQEHEYDAIVSDIKMPGMDGLALLAKIQELRPETPTLLITGHGEHDLAVQALRGGAYDFIQKPIDRDYLVAALQRAIQTHQLRRQVGEQQVALELHARSLERMVQKRTQELVEANAMKDTFLSMVSHELRTPLTSLKARAHLLHRQLERADSTEMVGLGLVDMERSICRMEVLVKDLLDASLIETNRFVLRRKRCNLVELCRNLLDEYTAGSGPAHIFEQYYRVPGVETQSGSQTGLGLGLYISRKLVERHAGRLDVHSVLGEGSVFSIVLPLIVDSATEDLDVTQLAPHTQAVWTIAH